MRIEPEVEDYEKQPDWVKAWTRWDRLRERDQRVRYPNWIQWTVLWAAFAAIASVLLVHGAAVLLVLAGLEMAV